MSSTIYSSYLPNGLCVSSASVWNLTTRLCLGCLTISPKIPSLEGSGEWKQKKEGRERWHTARWIALIHSSARGKKCTVPSKVVPNKASLWVSVSWVDGAIRHANIIGVHSTHFRKDLNAELTSWKLYHKHELLEIWRMQMFFSWHGGCAWISKYLLNRSRVKGFFPVSVKVVFSGTCSEITIILWVNKSRCHHFLESKI